MPLQEIYIKEKKIYLSEKTKSFYYLVEKNKINAEKLIKIDKNFFINETIIKYDSDTPVYNSSSFD